MSTEAPSLGRLGRREDTLWSYAYRQEGEAREIRKVGIVTPNFCRARYLDGELALKVSQCLQNRQDIEAAVLHGIDLSQAQDIDVGLRRRWIVRDITQAQQLDMQVLQLRPTYWERVKATFGLGVKKMVGTRSLMNPLIFEKGAIWTQELGESILFIEGAFSDSFTILATRIFQTGETSFVGEYAHAGSYQYALRENELRLEPKANPLKGERAAEIKAAVIAYRQYLQAAFGWGILDSKSRFQDELDHYGEIFTDCMNEEEQLFGYLKTSLDIDFQAMIAKGEPLLPDHVFKCNIAVNKIDMLMAESLFLRIEYALKKMEVDGREDLSSPQLFKAFLDDRCPYKFSWREIRGLYCSFARFSESEGTGARFKEYLNSFEGLGKTVHDLTPRAFHQLMEILCVDTNLADGESEEAECFYTGKKICDRMITGYKTMGDHNIYDPTRNVFELLHVFPEMRHATQAHYNEILGFLVVKKSMWSHHRKPINEMPIIPPWLFQVKERTPAVSEADLKQRRVGRLLPYPAGPEGQPRWYFVYKLINAHGNVNYVLAPACKGYIEEAAGGKRAPLIKLYRSTASDAEAEGSIDSLLADINPSRVGPADFSISDKYERKCFLKCTMPLWAAYLSRGKINSAVRELTQLSFTPLEFKGDAGALLLKRQERLIQFLAWQIAIDRPEKSFAKLSAHRMAADLLEEFKYRVGGPHFSDFLTKTIEGAEWDKDKIAQDIHFVGHSLGGALSQAGLNHFGPEAGRIPLFGCQYKCFAYDTPGVTREEARAFLAFGRKHRELLRDLRQKWEIHYQFERTDIVPQGGERFLGIPENVPYQNFDEDWLMVTARIYEFLGSTTEPVHCRRFQHLNDPSHYKVEEVSLSELNILKTRRFLPRSLRRKFGYNYSVPIWTDGVLRSGLMGRVGAPVLRLRKKFRSECERDLRSEADPCGVLACIHKTASLYDMGNAAAILQSP